MHSLSDNVKIVAVLHQFSLPPPTCHQNDATTVKERGTRKNAPEAGMAAVEVQGRRQGALIIVYFKGSLPPWAGRKPRPRDAEAPDA